MVQSTGSTAKAEVCHQLSIDEETRALATFSTPWGNYCPKRLIFRAKSSQDAFDEALFRVFGDLPNCLNQRRTCENVKQHSTEGSRLCTYSQKTGSKLTLRRYKQF